MIPLLPQRSRPAGADIRAVSGATCAVATPAVVPAEWLRLARLARLLSWLTLGWLGIEAGVAIGAAVIAGSVALLGFGLDSGIEALASIIVIWRFTGTRLASTLRSAARSGWSRSASTCSPPTSQSRPSARWRPLTAPRPASPGSCSPPAPRSWNPPSGSPSGAWAPGSDQRPPPGREYRTCSAPISPPLYSPGCSPTRCSAPGGLTALSHWSSLPGPWPRDAGPGQDAAAGAPASPIPVAYRSPPASSPAGPIRAPGKTTGRECSLVLGREPRLGPARGEHHDDPCSCSPGCCSA